MKFSLHKNMKIDIPITITYKLSVEFRIPT